DGSVRVGVEGVVAGACSACGVRAVRGSWVCGGCSVGVCVVGVFGGGVRSTLWRGGLACCPKAIKQIKTAGARTSFRMYRTSHFLRQFRKTGHCTSVRKRERSPAAPHALGRGRETGARAGAATSASAPQ